MRLTNILAEIASLSWLCYNECVPFLTISIMLFWKTHFIFVLFFLILVNANLDNWIHLGLVTLYSFFSLFTKMSNYMKFHFHIFRISANGDPLEKYYLWCLFCI